MSFEQLLERFESGKFASAGRKHLIYSVPGAPANGPNNDNNLVHQPKSTGPHRFMMKSKDSEFFGTNLDTLAAPSASLLIDRLRAVVLEGKENFEFNLCRVLDALLPHKSRYEGLFGTQLVRELIAEIEHVTALDDFHWVLVDGWFALNFSYKDLQIIHEDLREKNIQNDSLKTRRAIYGAAKNEFTNKFATSADLLDLVKAFYEPGTGYYSPGSRCANMAGPTKITVCQDERWWEWYRHAVWKEDRPQREMTNSIAHYITGGKGGRITDPTYLQFVKSGKPLIRHLLPDIFEGDLAEFDRLIAIFEEGVRRSR